MKPRPWMLPGRRVQLSEKDLAEVFSLGHYFGEPFVENIQELARALERNEIQCRGLWVPAVSGEVPKRLFNGSVDHQHQCFEAAQLLKSHRLLCEGAYVAGRYDLATEDERLFVECGYTRSGKVLAVCSGQAQLLVVPYSWTIPSLDRRPRVALGRVGHGGELSLDELQALAARLSAPVPSRGFLFRGNGYEPDLWTNNAAAGLLD